MNDDISKLRFKRGVLEGTFEELIDNLDVDESDIEKKAGGNQTLSERARRQAEIPDDPPQDNTK